jgi:hypothetical protein
VAMGSQADEPRKNGVLPAGNSEAMDTWAVAGAEMSTTVADELKAVMEEYLVFGVGVMAAVKAGREESRSILAVARKSAWLRNRDKRRGRHR